MYRHFPNEAQEIMTERFGHDNLIALATCDQNIPNVRAVNAYYENGAFYVITYALSNKMKQISNNPTVAITGDWFTAHGTGINFGWFGKDENCELSKKLKTVFASWIDNGDSDFSDENTIILCIRLTDGVLFSHGTRYDIDFTEDGEPCDAD